MLYDTHASPAAPGAFWLSVLAAVTLLASVFAASASGSHAEQKWAGFWHFTHLNSPTTGISGRLRACSTCSTTPAAADLLEVIDGVACPEPTDYFSGAYTVPDNEDLQPNQPFNDTGRFRGCTMDDRLHLRGRYLSDDNPAVTGDFELVLLAWDPERWNGTFTIDGVPQNYTLTGYFQGHFDDGAEAVSDPPYTETPEEPEPPPTRGPQPPGPVASETCSEKQATITPTPTHRSASRSRAQPPTTLSSAPTATIGSSVSAATTPSAASAATTRSSAPTGTTTSRAASATTS